MSDFSINKTTTIKAALLQPDGTFGPISDEIYIEKVVPQWAETQLEKQNSVSETGMYDQKINK